MSDIYCSMPNCQKRAHERYQGSPLCSNCMSAYIRGRNEEAVAEDKRQAIKACEYKGDDFYVK